MTRQFPHPHTTLPGHDPSKVRADIHEGTVKKNTNPPPTNARPPPPRSQTAPHADCITASASEALDVRVLKVAEWMAHAAKILKAGMFYNMASEIAHETETLRAIAAEIRDGATPRRPVAECNDVIAIWTADTVTELRDVWAGSSRRPEMEPIERIRLLEKAMGRLLVIEARHEGDGR